MLDLLSKIDEKEIVRSKNASLRDRDSRLGNLAVGNIPNMILIQMQFTGFDSQRLNNC